MDINSELTAREKKFLARTARREKVFLIFSILSVAAAIVYSLYHAVMKDFNGPRFVIVLLLLLSGRSHLRQYRSALIFNKLKSGLGIYND